MKALAIKQPWAWAIIHAGKDVENRTWKTKRRGDFLVHASKSFDHDGYKWIRDNAEKLGLSTVPEKEQFKLGGLIGKVTLTDCVSECDSPWFFGPIGFKLKNPIPLDFVPMKGKLSFFETNYSPEEYYFENEDANNCYPLGYFMAMAKDDDLSEISLLKAIPDFRNEEFIWCGFIDSATEKNECNKECCDMFTLGKSNIECDHNGNLYSHGESITFKVE